MRGRRLVAVLGVLAVLLAGCERSTAHDGDNLQPVSPAWQPLTLPAPPGAPGRLLLRDAVTCAGRWYVVGGVADAAGATRPAAWTSGDGSSWRTLPIVADSFYGKQNVLYSVGCRDGVAAVVGAKVGGAHGYPRVSTWRQRGDGALIEVAASFETYGGPKAVNVSRLTGGPAGWLIVGNRSSGAAAWVSPDAADFAIIEGAPELASDARGVSWAFDAVAGRQGWLAVGGVLPKGRIDRDPAVWTSPDGRSWQRTTLPGSADYEELQRVVLAGDTAVAVGLRGRSFGAWWQEPGGGWVAAGGFGQLGPGGVPSVSALVASGGRLLAAVSDGARHSVWTSSDRGGSWHEVVPATQLPAGADRDVSLVAAGDRWWLAADDGTRGALWWAVAGPAPG
ncbi:hypothetical protein ACVCAH_11865 [Micromonospora sp. LZ34]